MNPNVRPRARTAAGMGLAAAVLLAACTGNEEPSGGDAGSEAAASGSGDGCTIGMTQVNQTAVFTTMNRWAEGSAKGAGCDLTIANANNDSARQSSDIENFVAQGVDGIIVVAIDVNGVMPAVEAAQGEGIAVVGIDGERADIPNPAQEGTEAVNAVIAILRGVEPQYRSVFP